MTAKQIMAQLADYTEDVRDAVSVLRKGGGETGQTASRISMTEVSRQTGINLSMISRFANGKGHLSPEQLDKLADAMGGVNAPTPKETE